VTAADPLVAFRIVELSEIDVLVAQLRADALNGEIKGSVVAALFELTRLSNTAARLRESLGLNAKPPEILPSLDELLGEE
jgi:hypothetical protein